MNPYKPGRESFESSYPRQDAWQPTPGRVPVTARLAPSPNQAVEQAAGSSGAVLPDDLRLRFESCLDTDLSGVRVHTGEGSAKAADAIDARAYTTGQDIHFADGEFDPGSTNGMHLLAHEVAHTVQQGGRPAVQAKLAVSAPGDAHEQEADGFADAFVDGGTAPVRPGSVEPVISRAPAPDEKPAATPTENPTFSPRFVLQPDVMLCDLNEQFDVRLVLENYNEAPAGTEVEYFWPVGDGTVVRSIAYDMGGSRSSFTGKTIGVGTQALPVGVKISEPDVPGMSLSHEAPAPQITVDEPNVLISEVTSGAGAQDLRLGDTVKVEVTIDGVVDPFNYGKCNVQLGMNSHAIQWGMVAESLRPANVAPDSEAFEMKQVAADNPDSEAYEITTIHAGEGEVTVDVELPGAQPHNLSVKLIAKATADQFLDRCTAALAQHQVLMGVGDSYCAQVAAAYDEGYATFQRILAERAAREKLENDILMGVLFAGAGGFIGGAVGGALKSPVEKVVKGAAVRGALTDAPKDLAKFTAKLPSEFVGGGGSPGVSGGGGGAAPTDPFRWYTEVKAKTSIETAAVAAEIKKWIEAGTRAKNAGSDVAFDFDPVDAVNEATRIGEQRVDELGAVPTPLQFEQGFWNAWLTQYGYIPKDDLGGLSEKQHVAKNTEGEIDAHMTKLDERLWELGIGNGWRSKAMITSENNAKEAVEKNNKEVEEDPWMVQ